MCVCVCGGGGVLGSVCALLYGVAWEMGSPPWTLNAGTIGGPIGGRIGGVGGYAVLTPMRLAEAAEAAAKKARANGDGSAAATFDAEAATYRVQEKISRGVKSKQSSKIGAEGGEGRV